MRKTNLIIVLVTALGAASAALAEECSEFPPEFSDVDKLIHFLDAQESPTAPNDCVTVAIRLLGPFQSSKAVPTLIRYLDYKRPLSSAERNGVWFHPNVVTSRYPTISALATIGEASLPELVRVIGDPKTSPKTRDSAVFTVMLVHRQKPEEGISFLEDAANKATETTTGSLLQDAARKAADFCRADEHSRCGTLLSPTPDELH